MESLDYINNKMKKMNCICQAIGNTPLVELTEYSQKYNCHIMAKSEFLNPGGSIKSRTASWMIRQAMSRGDISENTTIVEATSGNQGIAVSMVGACLGLKVKIFMPENMSNERAQIMQSYGAEIELTPALDNIGETIQFAISRARELARNNSDVFWINQFNNYDNVDVHRRFTAAEILDQAEDPVDFFISGIGTGGTITGVGEVLKKANPGCKVIGVEPENAAILQGNTISNHIQQGIGDGLIPEILNEKLIDDLITVTDDEALNAARKLAAKSGLFVGISSGTNIAGALKVAEYCGAGKTIVTILPDNGERYFTAGLVI